MKSWSRLLVAFELVLIGITTGALDADSEANPTGPSLRETKTATTSTSESVAMAPSLSQPPDPGPIMLRCVGADGVFSFDESSDDFVGWAYPVEPVVLSDQFHAVYGFEALPPVGQRCRIFRAPFPGGVEPPPPPPPPPPEPPPVGGG